MSSSKSSKIAPSNFLRFWSFFIQVFLLVNPPFKSFSESRSVWNQTRGINGKDFQFSCKLGNNYYAKPVASQPTRHKTHTFTSVIIIILSIPTKSFLFITSQQHFIISQFFIYIVSIFLFLDFKCHKKKNDSFKSHKKHCNLLSCAKVKLKQTQEKCFNSTFKVTQILDLSYNSARNGGRSLSQKRNNQKEQ